MFAKSIATKGGDVIRDEYSLSFDGTNDYVDCGSDSSLDVGTNDFSVSAWCKVSTKGGSDYHDIVAKGNTLASGDGWGIALVESNKTIYLDTNGDVGRQNAVSPSDSWEFGKWYHIVGTRSNSTNTLKLYLNGVLVNTNALATNNDLGDSSLNFKIGTSESGRETKGNISEVAYYNSVLTANQVKTIYNGREPYNHKEGVASGNLQAWYRMGDGALDSKGNDRVLDWNGIIADEVTSKIGNELVANKTFSGSSNWTLGTGWSVGPPGLVGTNYSGTATQSLAIEANKTYQLSVDLTNIGDLSDINQISVGGYTFYIVQDGANSDAGVSKGYMKAANTDDLQFLKFGFGTPSITVRSMSVKEVTGNAGVMLNMAPVNMEGDTP